MENALAGRMMHARRPFTRALQESDPLAVPLIEGIQKLYQIERQPMEDALAADDRPASRPAEVMPMLEQLRFRPAGLSPLRLGKPLGDGSRTSRTSGTSSRCLSSTPAGLR